MNKIFKAILVFCFLITLSGCSFDDKTGLWIDKKIKKSSDVKLVQLSGNQNEFQKEFNTDLNIGFKTKAKLNSKWIMPGLNYSNSVSHLFLDAKSNNFSKFKFEKIPKLAVKENPIIIDKNFLITMGEKGSIVKFVNRKRVQWNRNVYSKKEKKKIQKISLALHKNILYALDNLGKYYAINVDTGEIIWLRRHDALFNSQIKVRKDKIFAIDSNNIINCFSAKDGKQIWKFSTPSTFIKTNKKLSLIVTSNSVIFSNSAGDIARVNINNGELVWFMPTQNTLLKHSTNFLETSDIVLFEDNLFFSNNFSKLFALNINSGELKWMLNVNSNLRPVLIDNFLFTISKQGYLIVIDKNKGEIVRSNYILGKFKKKEREKIMMQGFLIATNKIYITTNLGYLIICSVNTGKVEKVEKFGNSELSEPIINNNNLYILTNKSLVILS